MIREIQQEDNSSILQIIRSVMTEFKADPETTVLGDPSIQTMFENYQDARSCYFIYKENNLLTGGAGIKKLNGSDGSICELQRMFLLPESRGKGIGSLLIDKCIEKAREFSYKKIYLESLDQMQNAIALYHKKGFRKINSPLGVTGHSGCSVYMLLDL